MKIYYEGFLFLAIIHSQIHRSHCEHQPNDDILQENCQKGFYQCKNNACINETLICDKKRDCQDGDDEDGCVFASNGDSVLCAKTDGRCDCNYDRVFGEYINLNCANTGLVSFPTLVEGSKAKLLQITLSGSKIAKLTSEMFEGVSSLQNLLLPRNKINTIENNTFARMDPDLHFYYHYVMKTIDLSDNNITKLVPEIFQPLPRIGSLYLSRNQIRHIDDNTFADLAINFIDLSGNKLTKLTPGTFNGLKEVETLQLQDNEIVTIEKNTFCNLYELLRLNLSGNRITKLKTRMFEGMPSLVELYLQENQIDTIEKHLFDPLMASLYKFDLSGNKLSKLNARMFISSNPCCIRSINLRHNEITTIGKYALTMFPCAYDIDLSGNNLTELYADIFGDDDDDNIYWLRNLSLSMNNISQIEPATFKKLVHLEFLNLSGNPLHDATPYLSFNRRVIRRICCKRKLAMSCEWQEKETCEDLENWNTGIVIFIGLAIVIVIVAVSMYVIKKKPFEKRTRYRNPKRSTDSHEL